VLWEAATWPNVAGLAARPPTTTAFIERYKERERAAGRTPQVALVGTPYAAISSNVKRAVLVAEDINFFSHHGFDWAEIKSALEESVGRSGDRARRLDHQPAAREESLALSGSEPPAQGEGGDADLAGRARSGEAPHPRALSHVVEFGPWDLRGGRAAQAYFGKPAADLSETEAALLAASLPRPRSWHPGSRSFRVPALRDVDPLTHGQGRIPCASRF
jgi:monofunctional biosynthetic peptidoglycan transglycosylase